MLPGADGGGGGGGGAGPGGGGTDEPKLEPPVDGTFKSTSSIDADDSPTLASSGRLPVLTKCVSFCLSPLSADNWNDSF